ncbi:hypothetical protein ABT040_33630 [Streptomyces sp. NPDC002688]|uniref:effector-associated constant component EACC1 n=1 Tax=Streptomyces sp. NPDC002688 TaxID=3154423 RepID=UPI0033343E78
MQELQVSVTATSERFDADDDRWLRQVRLLHEGLALEVPLEVRPTAGVPGTKGSGLPSIVVLLGSASVGGAVAVIRDWLKRDRDRRIDLTWEMDGRKGKVTVIATTVDNASLQTALEHGLRHAIGAEPEDDPQADCGSHD